MNMYCCVVFFIASYITNRSAKENPKRRKYQLNNFHFFLTTAEKHPVLDFPNCKFSDTFSPGLTAQ